MFLPYFTGPGSHCGRAGPHRNLSRAFGWGVCSLKVWSVKFLAFTEPADGVNAKREGIVPMPLKGKEEILCVVGS